MLKASTPNKLPEKTLFILLLPLFKRQKPETQNEELLEQQLTTFVPKYIQSIVRTPKNQFDVYLADITSLSSLSVPYISLSRWSVRYRYLADNCWTNVPKKRFCPFSQESIFFLLCWYFYPLTLSVIFFFLLWRPSYLCPMSINVVENLCGSILQTII